MRAVRRQQVRDARALRDAAKLAQWRAAPAARAAIKEARLAGRVESIAPLIRRYVSEAEMRTIRRRGCLHSADFPEKRDQALRQRRRTDGQPASAGVSPVGFNDGGGGTGGPPWGGIIGEGQSER